MRISSERPSNLIADALTPSLPMIMARLTNVRTLFKTGEIQTIHIPQDRSMIGNKNTSLVISVARARDKYRTNFVQCHDKRTEIILSGLGVRLGRATISLISLSCHFHSSSSYLSLNACPHVTADRVSNCSGSPAHTVQETIHWARDVN
jgi:hypothetical protein